MADFDDPAERSSVGAGARGGSGGSEQRDEREPERRSSPTATVDLGGGVTAQVDVDTGRTVGVSGGGDESLEAVQLRERALTSGRSVFGQKLVDKFTSPKALGALGGAIVGGLVGIGPAAGAKLGAEIGGSGLFDAPSEKGTGFDQFAAIDQARAQQPSQAQRLGVSPSLAVGGEQFAPQQRQDESQQQALLTAAAGRQSGLAQAQPQVGQVRNPFVAPQQRFLNNRGLLPQVNIGAFPGALGRV